MLIKNGVTVLDRETILQQRHSSPLISTLRGLRDLVLLSDGTTANLDLVTGSPFTMAGGVGGAWTEESNWRTLLGVKAPVIAGARDNLLSNAQASFEDGLGSLLGPGFGIDTLRRTFTPRAPVIQRQRYVNHVGQVWK